MINLSPEMLGKVLSDSYEGTLIDLIEDSVQRIQSSTDNRAYVEKQATFISACIAELKKRKYQA